ncbi:cell wall glucanase [Hortaea werneckii]|nr:cell wall glucanase [Hortaea werneckii]
MDPSLMLLPSFYCHILAMSSPMRLATIALLLARPGFSQTYTDCNPLQSSDCPPDAALGQSIGVDFANGRSDQFSPTGNPTYDSNGVSLSVAQQGDAPTLISDWYIMFGRVEITMKSAPGQGIVSSVVLQSNDLDEIDWEWVGTATQQVQSNYFGKGQTGSYNRAALHDAPDCQNTWHKYTIDWTSDEIVWQIDGTTVRALKAQDSLGPYPQTPMQVKFGIWAGGDPSNPQGTIDWAGGLTDYTAGPYSMLVDSISVTDYSTGSEYTWSDQSGAWTSIKSNGGQINGNIGADTIASGDAPAVTTAAAGYWRLDSKCIFSAFGDEYGLPWPPFRVDCVKLRKGHSAQCGSCHRHSIPPCLPRRRRSRKWLRPPARAITKSPPSITRARLLPALAAAVNAAAVTTSSNGVVFLQTTGVGTLASGTAHSGGFPRSELLDIKLTDCFWHSDSERYSFLLQVVLLLHPVAAGRLPTSFYLSGSRFLLMFQLITNLPSSNFAHCSFGEWLGILGKGRITFKSATSFHQAFIRH